MIPVMEQIAAEYADEILVCQIDVNIAPAIADKYKINMLPTVILFDNGNVKNILTGVQSKTKIQSVLNE
jgi:thioredoxin 1